MLIRIACSGTDQTRSGDCLKFPRMQGYNHQRFFVGCMYSNDMKAAQLFNLLKPPRRLQRKPSATPVSFQNHPEPHAGQKPPALHPIEGGDVHVHTEPLIPIGSDSITEIPPRNPAELPLPGLGPAGHVAELAMTSTAEYFPLLTPYSPEESL